MLFKSQCRICSSSSKFWLSRNFHSQSTPPLDTAANPISPIYLLRLCLQHCQAIQSRHVFEEMPHTVSLAFKAAKSVHASCFRLGYGFDGRLGGAVVDLYAKCGSVLYGERAFKAMETRHVFTWNSLMSMYSRSSDLVHLVLTHFKMMLGTGVSPNYFTFAIVLSACSNLFNLVVGKQVHGSLIKEGFEFVSFCEGSLIDMYAKSYSITDAKRVFDLSIEADVVSWTAMIAGYVYVGRPEEALNVFNERREISHVPDQVTFVTVLNAFVKLGRFDEACSLFYRMPNPNVVAWNVMISGRAKKGYEVEAVDLFVCMRKAGLQGTRSTLGSVLSAIANTEALDCGLIVHALAVKQGLEANVYVGSSLINMYAKCREVEAAKRVFDTSQEKNLVLWNAMLGGYAQNGCASEVMGLYEYMKKNGVQPDEFTYTSILSACASLGYLPVGHQMHTHLIKKKLDSNLFVGNALVDMYAKFGSLEDAKQQFERIRNRDKVSWNAIIVGYVLHHEEEEAFRMFNEMAVDGIAPDEVSLASVLSACANLKVLELGEQIHAFSVKSGLDTSLYAGSSLIDMYAKCGALQASSEVLNSMPQRSAVSMNALISGYSQFHIQESVTLFQNMRVEGLEPSEVTFAALLNACDSPKLLNLGMQIHSLVIKMCLLCDVEFLGVSLVSMYINCLRNEEASALFYEFPSPKSAILWTAIISGYTQNDCSEKALQLYQEMRSDCAMPDQATFASVLKACSMLSSLVDGRLAHSLIFHTGFSSDELTGSALVDMYAKCGDVKSSIQVFREMTTKNDVISWNSMIVGLAKNGHGVKAMEVFDEMRQRHITPDDVTLLGVLTACSHSGKVSEGRKIFDTVVSQYNIKPRVEHCACMVDLLGRWGFLSEAVEFIDKVEVKPNAMIWSTLLGACSIHGNESIGKRAARELMKIEPKSPSPYVLLANIHAKAGNWDEVNSVRKEMNEQGVMKLPGCSWIAVGQKTHSFVAGDKSHPSAHQMFATLKDLVALMKDFGSVTGTESESSSLHYPEYEMSLY
uniref:Pentatricopeptide repeat-containing protein n=1 Tax=Kalanchoe fedtschenkoi TaxID=63787 RepID=A0A7N0THV1_KALFE